MIAPFRASLLQRLKRLNSRLNDLEALAGIAKVQARPCHLEVDFSSRCNFRCPMCHQSKLDMGRFQLQAHDIDAIVDTLPYVETVMIAGLGEPLLYPGLKRFMPNLKRYGCNTHLFTNGELIDRRLDLIKDIDRISVSVDGATADTFEILRKGGHFDRVVANIGLLRVAAPRTRLVTSTVVSKLNLREIAAIVALAESLSMQEVHLSPVDHTPSLALDQDDEAVFLEQLALAARQSKKVVVMNNLHAIHFAAGRNAAVDPLDVAKGAASSTLPADELHELWSADRDSMPGNYIQGKTAAAEIGELMRRVKNHTHALRGLEHRIRLEGKVLKQPYCSAPWKYAFARSRGDARLCPYADIDVGKVSTLMAGPYNSPILEDLRASMADASPCLSVCRSCTDDHRQFKRDSLQTTLETMPKNEIRLT